MIYIKKLNATDFPEIPDVKWAVVNTNDCPTTYDVCTNLRTAIRYWLWHLGVSSKNSFLKHGKEIGFCKISWKMVCASS